MTVFRPSEETWYSRRSSDGQVAIMQFDSSGDKLRQRRQDHFAVWRPSDGNYYVYRSSDSQMQIAHWGANGDLAIGVGGPLITRKIDIVQKDPGLDPGFFFWRLRISVAEEAATC